MTRMAGRAAVADEEEAMTATARAAAVENEARL